MYSIILNPASGKGLAARTLPKLEALLREAGIKYRVDRTVRAGDSRLYARRAVEDGLEGVIAVGGDGTFFEVVNGIALSGLEVIFAPCGTGNDFVKTFRLPRETVKAVRLQLGAKERRVDLGKFNDMYFLNVAGAGFDVSALIETEKFKKRFNGLIAYLLGSFSAIRRLKPLRLEMEIDRGAPERIESTIISVGNGRYIGGGMRAVPNAVPDDGLFDVVIARRLNKLTVGLLLFFFVLGIHTKLTWLCRSFRCRQLNVAGVGAVEADGEIFRAETVAFEVLPRALRTRLPA
jgi:YegS/Rv2252/BmrU family lipid kinase